MSQAKRFNKNNLVYRWRERETEKITDVFLMTDLGGQSGGITKTIQTPNNGATMNTLAPPNSLLRFTIQYWPSHRISVVMIAVRQVRQRRATATTGSGMHASGGGRAHVPIGVSQPQPCRSNGWGARKPLPCTVISHSRTPRRVGPFAPLWKCRASCHWRPKH